jgi:hypothetical protein
MPEGRRGGSGCEGGGGGNGCNKERVEVTRTIAPGDHAPGLKILHRKTERVKLYRTIIISGEATNGNQILNNARSYQNIGKNK